MAKKRGVASIAGFVGAMGIRYTYTEGRDSKRPKLACTATQNEALYKSVLIAVQEVSNATVRVVEQFNDQLNFELCQLRGRIQTTLPGQSTACFTFPMASIGLQPEVVG